MIADRGDINNQQNCRDTRMCRSRYDVDRVSVADHPWSDRGQSGLCSGPNPERTRGHGAHMLSNPGLYSMDLPVDVWGALLLVVISLIGGIGITAIGPGGILVTI